MYKRQVNDAAALEAAVPVFHERCRTSWRRQAVIDATPELQERELLKRAALAAAMADALRSRDVPDPAARLAAEVGVIAFKTAFARWVNALDEESDERALAQLIRESLDQLKATIAGE